MCVYSFQSCTLLFYVHCPCSCVCSWSSLHTYCRRPRVDSSSGLNITFAISRGILTCQSLPRVCKLQRSQQTGCAVPALLSYQGSSRLNGNRHPKHGCLGSGRNQFSSQVALLLCLLHAESPGLHIIGETGPSSPLNSVAGAPSPILWAFEGT